MSNALLSSKIIVEEEPPRIRSVTALPTAVLALVGISERGPMHVPTLCTSFEEWVTTFGRVTVDNLETYGAVQAFFEEGGQFLWFSRTAHHSPDNTSRANVQAVTASITADTAPTAPTAGVVTSANAETYALTAGQTLLVAIDGNPADTVIFDAAAAAITAANTENYALSDGLTLTVRINGGSVQIITFNTGEFVSIGAATALEVAAVINAEISGASADTTGGAPRITTDRQGTGASVEVTGGTANAILGFSTTPVAGTGDVADISAVTVAEAKTVIEADATSGSGVTVSNASGATRITSNTTGASSSVQVTGASTATAFGFDNATHSGTTGAALNAVDFDGKTPGAYANALTVVVSAATNGASEQFNIDVQEDGITVESFQNLGMDASLANYIEDVLAADGTGSNLIAAVDQFAVPGDPALSRPANGSYTLTGGDNGLTGIDDNAFVGSSVGDTGVHAFDETNGLTLLAIPQRATSAVHNKMLTYCEVTRSKSMFAVLDPPAGQTAANIITYVETTAQLLGASEHGAIYWPRVKVLNPNTTIFGTNANVTIPPSGMVAGVMARVDNSTPGGVYIPPAGPENGQLRSAVGFETDEVNNVAKRDLVFPKRINILDSEGGVRNIDGARTLKADGNFPTVGERRGVIFIEQSIKAALEFARHQNNTPELRRTVERIVENFLLNQMGLNAFRSKDPATAFFVDFGDGLNTTATIFAGQLIGRIGLATNKPAEFIILKFSQDTRALEQELAG